MEPYGSTTVWAQRTTVASRKKHRRKRKKSAKPKSTSTSNCAAGSEARSMWLMMARITVGPSYALRQHSFKHANECSVEVDGNKFIGETKKQSQQKKKPNHCLVLSGCTN